ncbi:MAG TPA: hypothetical protein VJ505_15860 [Holophagaceae bacterium]|nr:hypothetical protein [Holophagaceae bacterium]
MGIFEPNQSPTEVRVRRGGFPASVEEARPWAQRLADYAGLAARVYHDPSDVPALPAWRRVPGEFFDSAQTSLFMEVWERDLDGGGVEVALAFRGTAEKKDWWSNARWITRYLPLPLGWDQYPPTRELVAPLIERALARHAGREVRFVSVGHSLGGGLAQHAAYAHVAITQVYAFDSSPVTGFRDFARAKREAHSQGLTIHRAFEHGEILAYFRLFLRKFVPLSLKDPEIVEVRFNFGKGEAVHQHSMVDLAVRMGRMAAG